jgi:hypothetical protein
MGLIPPKPKWKLMINHQMVFSAPLFNVSPGPKGCEVFESVGENYQKLPTKAPLALRAVEGPICQVDVSSGWFKPRIIGCIWYLW